MRAIRVMLPKWIDCELLCGRRGNRTGRGKFYCLLDYWQLLAINPSDRTSLRGWRDSCARGTLISWQRSRHAKRAARQRGKISIFTRLSRQKTTALTSPLIPPATQAEGWKGPLKNVVTCHRLDFNSLPPPPPPKWLLSWNHLPILLGSLRIDDFRTTTPLDCVTGLLRMLIWALASVAPKSTPLLTAIRRRPRKSRTWD